jgi:two-component system, NarL family, sensor histidine kinase UhpB
MVPSEGVSPLGEARKTHGSTSQDLGIVIMVTVGTFLFASTVELNEWILSMTRRLEPYQLDELPITITVLALATGWFAWRRWLAFSKEFLLRQAAQQALAELLAENRLLAQRNVLAQEAERRMLARELHDELGQSLNAIKLDAVAIRQRVPDTGDEIHQNAAAIIDVTNHVHETVRTLTQRLRPVALDELGLGDALELYVRQWERRNPPIRCSLETSGSLDRLGELVNITVYRCVQECLTNVTRHAKASVVTIAVSRSVGTLELLVADDGQGMELTAKRDGVGLRERAEALKGAVELTSSPGKGMQVRLQLPLTEQEQGR